MVELHRLKHGKSIRTGSFIMNIEQVVLAILAQELRD